MFGEVFGEVFEEGRCLLCIREAAEVLIWNRVRGWGDTKVERWNEIVCGWGKGLRLLGDCGGVKVEGNSFKSVGGREEIEVERFIFCNGGDGLQRC